MLPIALFGPLVRLAPRVLAWAIAAMLAVLLLLFGLTTSAFAEDAPAAAAPAGGPCVSGAASTAVIKKQLETQPAMSLLISESPISKRSECQPHSRATVRIPRTRQQLPLLFPC